MNTFRSRLVRLVLLAAVCVGMTGLALALEPSYRAAKWDISGEVIYSLASDFDGERGSRVEVDDDLGFGFAAGYNYNPHFQLGGSFNWDTRSYNTTGIGGNGSALRYYNELESTTLGLNGYYFILPGNVTPFISASIGYVFVDSNIQDGPTEAVYYYDPWWGYTYGTYTPTRTESGLCYGGGIGLRWDFNERLSLQLSYNKAWLDVNDAVETPDVDTIRLLFIGRSF